MIQEKILFLLLGILSFHPSKSQGSTTHASRSVEQQADSVSKLTDSLILSHGFLHLVVESKHEGDTATSYRHYYIDTVNDWLVKFSIDTSFADFYNRVLNQAVFYFDHGYQLKACYAGTRDSIPDFCSPSSPYPYTYQVRQQVVKLDKGWTKETIDERMRYYLNRDIVSMKYIQKKYN